MNWTSNWCEMFWTFCNKNICVKCVLFRNVYLISFYCLSRLGHDPILFLLLHAGLHEKHFYCSSFTVLYEPEKFPNIKTFYICLGSNVTFFCVVKKVNILLFYFKTIIETTLFPFTCCRLYSRCIHYKVL